MIPTSQNDFLIKVLNASVYLKGEKILNEIDWTMKEGENWAVVGNNGSGKTTFLKLIFGELIPLYGGEISWFGRKGLHPLKTVRRRLGYISAEYQTSYDRPASGLAVVLSGFFSSVGLYKTPEHMQRRTAIDWMDRLNISDLAKKNFLEMSYGEARRVLLARALVHHPDILILDEPCAGLDIPNRELFLNALDDLGQSGTHLIFVTHRVEELVPSLTHVLYLKNGSVFHKGIKQEMITDSRLSKVLDCQVSVAENSGRYWITKCKA